MVDGERQLDAVLRKLARRIDAARVVDEDVQLVVAAFELGGGFPDRVERREVALEDLELGRRFRNVARRDHDVKTLSFQLFRSDEADS